MPKFIRRNIDSTIENNFLTAAIMSTVFLEEIYHIYNPIYLHNTFARKLMAWVLEYFEQFEESPKQTIQNIFEIKKEQLDDAELDIMQTFLITLSKNYVEGQGVNDEYILEQSMQYFRKREVEVRVDNAQKLISIGRVDKAEEELINMKKVVRLTSNWSDPFAPEMVQEVFDDRKKALFRFPGDLGRILGNLERGWFVAFIAPFKRGKTWLLQEAAVVAALSGLKAVFISLEMKNSNINERLYKRLTAYGSDGVLRHKVPVFDCMNNQTGTCTKATRENVHILWDGVGDPPEFVEGMSYRACSCCKGSGVDSTYELATWFEMMDKLEFSLGNVSKRIKAVRSFYGDNLRVKCYPRFTATVSDIERDLNLLEQTEGFIPDVIVVDYADILKPEGQTMGREPRHGIDEIWKNLASMAAERSALLFSASQGNRGSLYKENIDQADLAEWIGKLGHVDLFASVNQSTEEKKKGVVRIGMLAHRHKEFHENDHCMLLQHFALGQVHLDSYNMW